MNTALPPASVTRKFVRIYLFVAGIALLQPISVVAALGVTEGLRWIGNDPATIVFMVLFFPLSVSAFFSVFDRAGWRRLPRSTRRTWIGLLAILEILAIGVVWRDAVSPSHVVIPNVLSDSNSAAHYERALRDELPQPLLLAKNPPYDKAVEARKLYMTRYPGFSSAADYLERTSWSGKVGTLLNAVGGSFLALFVWYLVFMAWHSRGKRSSAFEALTLVYCILLLWLPLRVYSEWYLNFFTLEGLQDYVAFQVLIGIGLLIAVLLLMIQSPRARFTKWLIAVEAGLAALVTALAEFNAEALWWIGNLLWRMSLVSWVALLFVAMLVLLIQVRNVLVRQVVVARGGA